MTISAPLSRCHSSISTVCFCPSKSLSHGLYMIIIHAHLRHALHETSCIFLILSPRNPRPVEWDTKTNLAETWFDGHLFQEHLFETILANKVSILWSISVSCGFFWWTNLINSRPHFIVDNTTSKKLFSDDKITHFHETWSLPTSDIF